MATPLDPNEVIGGIPESPAVDPRPNAPNVGGWLGTGVGAGPGSGFQYTVTYRDGREVTYWYPKGGSRADAVEVYRSTDPKQHDQFVKDQEEARKQTESGPTGTSGQAQAATQHHYENLDAQAQANAQRAAAQQARSNTIAQGQLDLATQKQNAAPALNLPAARPGQMTDLGLVEAQANQFIAGVNADTSLNPQQRQAKIQTYLDTTVKPAAEAATREANAYAQQQQQRQQQADTIAQQAAARAGRTEERQATTAERQTAVQEGRLALDTQTASYNRGQDAVSNALKLLQYQVDPSFSPSLAGIYNRIIPGAFQPNSFQTALPDIDAIAQAHIGPLLDMHASPVTGPSAQAGPAVPPGYPLSAPAQPGQPDPLANVPITPRAPYPQPGGTGVVGRFGQ